jgi:hypothetical protein
VAEGVEGSDAGTDDQLISGQGPLPLQKPKGIVIALMVMGIDQAGQDRPASGIDRLIDGRKSPIPW